MSTRATIIINDKNGKRAIAIYKHSDGYIHRGLGADLFNFMRDRSLNGRGSVQVNGIGDLAAQLVTHLKGDERISGDTYIMEQEEQIHNDIEYVYYITPVEINQNSVCPLCGALTYKGNIEWEIKIEKDGKFIWAGTPENSIAHFDHNPLKPLF
jgi:hypothetical protein